MSDEKMKIPYMDVWRADYPDSNYYVRGYVEGVLKPISKGYKHSTSAYAKLGRMVQHYNIFNN